MNQKCLLLYRHLLVFGFLIGGLLYSFAQEAVPFTPRLNGGNIEIRGDIVYVGNNILNRASESNPTEANTAYNGTQNNNSLWMEYIDIDGDSSTFSSSSAEMNIPDPDCSQVRYAGLYWAATYPNERSTDGGASFSGTPRIEDWFNIKFKVPGGNYVDLTADTTADPAGEEDDIIFDGYDYSNINNSFKDSPYICYKNVTDLVRSNSNPSGEYTVANVRATKGRRNGSSSAGWVMVVIYENPTETGKFISTFDGYAGMSGSVGTVNVPVNGFKTLPTGFPVNARLGVGALEGDRGINNDRFRIRANTNASYTDLSTTNLNPANNFFNSTISINDAQVPDRTPYGTNTLGLDLDIFDLSNPNNAVLPNDETGAIMQFTSTGDGYGAFLATFLVEQIEPDIALEKRVEDIGGNDITGLGVNLGQTLDYVLSFQNLGNDHGVNYTIRDVLPLNVTLDETQFVLPAGVTYTFDAPTRTVTFTIPDNLVNKQDPVYTIRMRVKVAENCFDFVDACTDLIQNLAYSTYSGEINSNVITDDPSVSDFDNCGFAVPGATNFLLDDLADCNFTRTVELCGASAILDAGDNFDDYIWVRDDNNNDQIDPTDTVLNDGDPDNDLSTQVVNGPGTYIVDKIVADPCKGFQEIINVVPYGSGTITNPIIDYFNDVNSDADLTNDLAGEIVQCSVDNALLPKLFLCGINDTRLLQVNIIDAQSLQWEQLDESSCTASGDDCANKNLTCTWNSVGAGNNYTLTTAGKYRLAVTYQNGCTNRFYFNVFQNTLDIQYNKKDIVCTALGNITVTNLGNGYAYRLVDADTGTVILPFSPTKSFDFASGENGDYRVEVIQLDGSDQPIDGSCIFSTPDIGILDRNVTFDVNVVNAGCSSKGSINLQVNNANPNYEYEIRLDDGSNGGTGTLVDNETAQPDNNFTFENLNPGDYIAIARTDDGCSYTEQVSILDENDLELVAQVTQHITCSDGNIQMDSSGGETPHSYAIWTYTNEGGTIVTSYSDVNDIPASAFQTSVNFEVLQPGDYIFVVVDRFNCPAFSNEVTIEDRGALTIDSISETQPSCSGDNDGALTINVSNGVGPYRYSIDNGATYQNTPNFVNLSAGTYNIRVLDNSDCEVSQSYSLEEPFPLSASAGISRDATCDPNGAEVRITNVVGGNPPYEYSFDGGLSYGSTTIAVLPPGSYTVIVRDASCEFPMDIVVEDLPDEPEVTLTPEVSYDCDGGGTITATPNITTYNYTYALDGVLNSPDPTSNVFLNVPPGTYTVSTTYVSQTPPTPSLLLSENFGSGSTIPSPNTNGYGYEDQTTNPPGDSNRNINDFEYSVTSDVVAPFGSWINPIDHTSGTRTGQGRYLVMNVGTPTPTQIIYSKEIRDIIPNRDLSISFYVMNLLRQGRGGLDPDLTVEIREIGTGNIVQSIRTGAIRKNTGALDWIPFTGSLNPGSNTSLEFVIRSEITGNSGNDFALDDIEIFQVPEVCELYVETPVTVEAARVFSANITASSNVSCNGESDATITFEAENFDATSGFDYSLDGGTTWTNSTSSPVTTTTAIGAGTQRIDIRKANEPTCGTFVEQTITQPNALEATANITTPYSCTNGGATITASATGGMPTYEYQLEDNAGNVIGAFDFTTNGNNNVFAGLAPGDYLVRVRDNNTCEGTIDTALTVADTNPVTFDVTPTACYTGGSSATIQVDVTNGNGNYTFSLNGNPWITPSPATATTHTFTGLANGTYTVNVSDGSGCIGTLETVIMNPELTVTASAPNITSCATDTDITISAAGGDNNYVYAVVANGDPVADGDFTTTNPVTVSTAGDYDIHVRDNNGSSSYCATIYTITVVKDTPIDLSAAPSAVTCFGGSNGAISIAINSGGNGPFRYSIDNGSTYVTSNNFPNLSAGTYPVRVIDANGCESVPEDVIVSEPTQLIAEATITQNYTCLSDGEITVGNATATSGGSGDYQYSLNGGTWTASTTGGHTFTGLSDGTYNIRVRDANAPSCEITLAAVVIDPLPTAPSIDYSVSYNCNGTGDVSITPFDTNYIYILDGVLPGQTGAGANTFTNISVGTHTLRITYGPDCHVDTTVVVEDGNAFEASIISFENLDCNGDTSGSITIGAYNYGAGGFEYSINGGSFVGPFFAAEQLTGLSAIAHSIEIRDVDNAVSALPGCTVVLNQTLTEPNLIIASASITEAFTCNNTGATITASASGGTPAYQYQLEDNSGGIIVAYQTPVTFTNVPVGDYIVRARDINNCEDPIDTAINVTGPTVPAFTTMATTCYSGANDASIQVDVTAGNGGYQFRLNSGPWITPAPVTATTHTFQNLSDGTYVIEVRDQFGCPLVSNAQNIIIDPQLVVSVDAINNSACNDGTIAVNASGGNGTLVYAIVPANTSPTGLYSTTNSLTITNAMATANPTGYDVYVLDGNGTGSCSFLQEDIILTPVAPLTVSGTATDPECFDGLGSIDAVVGGGTGPFTYTLVDLSPSDGIDYGTANSNIVATSLAFNGIGIGDYEITITDVNSCTVTSSSVTINNAIEITADIVPILPATCNDPDPLEYGFEFDNVITPTGTVEFSADAGATWQTSNELRGYASGTEVYPSIRVEVAPGVYCQKDFDRYIIPFPLDDLDITLSAVIVGCNDLRVTVEGSEGNPIPGYEYTYTDDPANFNTFISDPNVWTAPLASGTSHTFQNINPTTAQYPEVPLLIPGRTYVFYVRDGSGCIRQSNVNVNDIPGIGLPIDITVDVTPSCFGDANGAITFNLNPTTAYPNMRWEIYELGNPAPIETSGGIVAYNNSIQTTVNLAEGEYYIDVVQVDGGNADACRGASENAYVPELNELDATATATRDISCNLPGLISISGISGGGGPPYTFDVTGPAGFTALTGLNSNPIQIPVNSPAGNYTVTLNDQYDCPLVLSPVTLSLSPNPTITSVTQENCSAPINLTVVGNSAAGNIRYAIVPTGNPAPTSYLDNAGIFTNITPGSYDVYIIDGNGCTNSQTSYVVHPVLSATATLTKLLDCTASPEATINIEALVGSGNYEYSITNTAGAPAVAQTAFPSNSFDYQAPLAGDYTITIYDTNTPDNVGCNREFVLNVPARLEPVVDTITTTDVTCLGDADGSITISAVDNAIGPYTFEITSIDGAATSISPTSTTNISATFTGLAPTTTAAGYIVTITGNSATNNCATNSTAITISEPSAISVTMDPTVEFVCTVGNNENNASISVQSVSGGSNTFVRYQFINDLNPGTPVQDGTNDAYIETSFAGGNYTINVFDDNGCVGTTTASIAPFDQLLSATITIDQAISCVAGENITINAFGSLTDSNTPVGLANYEFRQLPSGTFGASNVFTNLPVGTHNFEVRNVNTNCVISISHTVNEPNNFEITATTVDVVCHGTDGSVTFTINDAVNPYTDGFSWQIYDSQGTTTTADDILMPGAAGVSANVGPIPSFAIGAGEYRVEVTQDSNPSCVTSELFAIAGPTSPITGSTNVTPVTCVGNDGIIEIVNAQGGWSGLTYFVAPASDPAPTFPGSYVTSPRFTALSGGIAPGTDYQVWIADSSGCEIQLADVTLVDPTPITADLQINQPNCTDLNGEIEVINETGGQGSNYRYQLQVFNTTTSAYEDLRPIQTSDVFSGLGAGQYQVVVSDQWSCSGTTSTPIELYAPIAPLVTVIKTIDCSTTDPGGQITISQTGGSGAYNYSVTYPDGTTTANNTTGTFTGLDQVGDYVFTIADQDVDQACPINMTQRLDAAVYPILSIDSSSNVSCNGADDGTISVSVVDNGVGPYTFVIVSGPGSAATFPIAATSSTNTTAVFTGLEGSIGGITYTIEARGANNCEITTTATITELDAILVDPISITQYACTDGNNQNNATVSFVNASGGTNTFVRHVFIRNGTVVQDGANSTYFETDGLGGNYEIQVFDDAGCFATSATDTVLPFFEISDAIVTTTQEAACSPLNNGQINVGVTVNPAGPIPNLEYTVAGINVTYNQTIPSTNSSETFTGLAFGNYRISIANMDTGCIIETVHTINNPDIIEAIASKLTDEECLNNGMDEGSFEVQVNNYTGSYSYQVYDINDNSIAGFAGTGSAPNFTISGLSAGVYYVRVSNTAAPLCEDDSNVVTIVAPSAPITATIREEANVTCSNDQGKIFIDPIGGEGPYSITIDSGSQTFTQTNVEAFIFEGLSAGSYDVTITDAFGCVLLDNVTLIQPDIITPTIPTPVLSCFNDNDASITTTIAPRTNPIAPVYEYQLWRYGDNAANTPQESAFQSSPTFTGLSAGFYRVFVKDDVSCSNPSNIIEIVNPEQVHASLTRTNPLTCTTGVEFELTATGGSGTYEYSVDNINFVPMTSNPIGLPATGSLGAGTYQYYVRDAINLCDAVVSNSIAEDAIDPLSLIVDETAAFINCNGDATAVIYASATGGLGNYMFELYANSVTAANRIIGPQPLGEFIDLTAGTYWVTVTSEDCTTAPQEVIIADPEPLTYTDEVIDVSCFGEENGSITVSLSGGSGNYIYAISPNLDQFDTINTFTELAPGDYVVIAQDGKGCFEYLEYTISAPAAIDVNATTTPEICAGSEDGTLGLVITGGTAPYSTAVNSNADADFVQDRADFTDLAAGNYILFVRDANGCEANLTVTIDAGVNLNASVEPIYECTGNTPDNYIDVTLEDAAIGNEVLYALDSNDPNAMQLSADFRNIAPGSHYITIAHSNGCVNTIDFEIENFEPLTLMLEQNGINEITAVANGGRQEYTFFFDDVNNNDDNTFYITRTDTYTVTVVDENGCEATASIFMEFIDIEIPNFFTPDGDSMNDFWKPNNIDQFPEILIKIFDRYGRVVSQVATDNQGWDGTYKGAELPTGDYWYVIQLNGEEDEREFIGHFTLYR